MSSSTRTSRTRTSPRIRRGDAPRVSRRFGRPGSQNASTCETSEVTSTVTGGGPPSICAHRGRPRSPDSAPLTPQNRVHRATTRITPQTGVRSREGSRLIRRRAATSTSMEQAQRLGRRSRRASEIQPTSFLPTRWRAGFSTVRCALLPRCAFRRIRFLGQTTRTPRILSEIPASDSCCRSDRSKAPRTRSRRAAPGLGGGQANGVTF